MFFADLTREQVFKKWIAALRSGAYVQGQGTLRRLRVHSPPTYCCIGVLCDLDTEHNKSCWTEHGFAYGDRDESIKYVLTFIPSEMQDWLGLSDDHVERLYAMNDDEEDHRFVEIADYLEKVVMPETLAKLEQQV